MTGLLPKSPAARRSLWVVLTLLTAASVATWLVLSALQQDISFYKTPSELQSLPPGTTHYRLGGLVQHGTVSTLADGVTTRFQVTDNKASIPVEYKGLLPDLFRDGQGVVAEGILNQDGVFVADRLLARHDENYMPPEVAKAIKHE